jgi:hypothetical protein
MVEQPTEKVSLRFNGRTLIRNFDLRKLQISNALIKPSTPARGEEPARADSPLLVI